MNCDCKYSQKIVGLVLETKNNYLTNKVMKSRVILY